MDNKEVEELAEIMDKFRFTQCPDCSNPTLDCWECQARYLINADYHKVESVQLEVLKFKQEEILGLIPAQAILDYDRAKEVLEKVSQATIDQYKGQLYRIKEAL
jgi:hypothetical protein